MFRESANRRLRQAFLEMDASDRPPPWRPVSVHHERPQAVGFGAGTELLAVLDNDGMEIVNCVDGAILAQNAAGQAPNPVASSVIGIGPLAGHRIELASDWGGGLKSWTADGWRVRRVAPNWPDECAVLYKPSAGSWADWSNAVKWSMIRTLSTPWVSRTAVGRWSFFLRLCMCGFAIDLGR